jgi:predicted O-methyltransferase YrrM
MSNFSDWVLWRAGVKKPATDTSKVELECLGELAADARVVIEIGVFQGVCSRVMANAMHSSGTYIGVDIFAKGKLGFCWYGNIARETMRLAGGPRVLFVTGDSTTALQHRDVLSVLPADLIFIDADHSYEASLLDWTIWREHVRSGGVIAFHDSAIGTGAGCERMVREHVATDTAFTEENAPGSLRVFRRN